MQRLKGLRCYLAGPIDHADDDGVGWRKKAGLWLKQKGVHVMDPCDKPTSNSTYKEIGEEKIRMMDLKDNGEWDELTRYMKEIVHVDLRMLDRSDFVIVYIDMEAKPFGTIWELQTALHQKKPVMVVVEGGKSKVSNWLFGVMNHNWIFGNFPDMYRYLNGIHHATNEADLTRWVFFDDEEE
tara:strand:+ start:1741 stop:2286 length:546 start_codon:yes stop_codon:yes gene_type:complete